MKKLQHEGCIYFIQKWTELTYIKTIDSYQYSIHNTYTAVKESLRLATLSLDGTYPTLDNLIDGLKELSRFLKEDIVLMKYNKGLHCALLNVSNQKIEPKNDSIKIGNLRKLISSLQYQLSVLDEYYLNWITFELIKSVEQIKYEEIDYYSNALVSQCISDGWSEKALFNIHYLLLDNDQDDLELLQYAISTLKGPVVDFDVYIKFYDSLKVDEFCEWSSKFEIEILSYDEVMNRCAEPLKKYLNIQSDKHYFAVKTSAKDYISAALYANERCKKMMELLTFYNISHPWTAEGEQIFVRYQDKFVRKTSTAQIYGTNLYIEGSNPIFNKTLEIFSNQDPSIKNIQVKLQSVYSYMNISKLAIYQEEKFLNMWIGLESFMNTGNYSNIIAHIKNVLPSVMCQRYLYKLVRNLCEDFIRCDISLSIQGNVINLENLNKNEMVVEIISHLKNETSLSEILSQVNVNSLLRERVKSLGELFKNEKKMYDKIVKYNDTIYWHTQRLYRLRNDITHSGYLSNSDITPYIEHLHNFVASLIIEVVHIVSNPSLKITNVGAALAYLTDCYESFKNKYSTINSVYETGVIKLE